MLSSLQNGKIEAGCKLEHLVRSFCHLVRRISVLYSQIESLVYRARNLSLESARIRRCSELEANNVCISILVDHLEWSNMCRVPVVAHFANEVKVLVSK